MEGTEGDRTTDREENGAIVGFGRATMMCRMGGGGFLRRILFWGAGTEGTIIGCVFMGGRRRAWAIHLAAT